MKRFNCLLLLLPLAIASTKITKSENIKSLEWGKDGMINYGDLGKLKKSQLSDVSRSDPYPPQKPEGIDTGFYVLINGGSKLGAKKYRAPVAAQNIDINPGQPTIFIVHGFKSSGSDAWLKDIGKKILYIRKKYNIIIIDWKKGASGGTHYSSRPDRQYRQAASNTWTVGGQIWMLCQNLNRQFQISYEDMHIIGHSLGSHVAGYVGARLKGRLGRISALDAAKPEFEDTDPYIRLDPTDAKFVDAIHTDISDYKWYPFPTGFGMKQPIGHVDFYPNGGENQPKCTRKAVSNFRGAIGCRHGRAYELYAQSIVLKSCSFLAHKCSNYENYLQGKCKYCHQDGNNCVKMGYFSNTFKNPNGTVNNMFYLLTTDDPPFCAHHYSVQLVLKKHPLQSGNFTISLNGNGKTHTFKMSVTNLKTITQITGSHYDLGPVRLMKLQLVCPIEKEWDGCKRLIETVVVNSLDIPAKS